MKDIVERPTDPSILVMSRDGGLAQRFAGALGPHAAKRLTAEAGSFAEINGRASSLIAGHDVVVFDSRQGDELEFDALSQVLSRNANGPLFLALADEDMPLSTARKLREAGVGEVLPNTISGSELVRVVGSLLEARMATGTIGRRDGAIISVAQARGGVGATTVAVNVALKLIGKNGIFRKGQRRRVALVDFDLQFGNANAFLDLEDKGGLLDLIHCDHAPDASYLKGIMRSHASGLDVLCAPNQMVPVNALSSRVVTDLLDLLRRHYDYVVVDLPQALVEWVSPVLERASTLVLVTDTSVPCIRQARRLVDFYHQDHPALKIEFAVNRESRPMFKSAEVREAEGVLETRLTHWLPDAPREARKAADLGRPMVDLYPSCGLSKAIGKLAQDIAATLPVSTHQTA